ncbi:MAG TPA: hypothetical protein VM370_11540 [Candidatus Thermoplasmatota archaeon]|nr:hypothetical protein [Candidatus Thermoplasmatota archaeon]
MTLSLPAVAQVGSAFDVHVERLIASPTPAGPLILLNDEASWVITIPEPTEVLVEAQSAADEPFYLTTDCRASVIVLPTSHDAVLCHPGVRRLQVDPAAGVDVDIIVRFRGHVVDLPGASSEFELVDRPASASCVVPGVCLP